MERFPLIFLSANVINMFVNCKFANTVNEFANLNWLLWVYLYQEIGMCLFSVLDSILCGGSGRFC